MLVRPLLRRFVVMSGGHCTVPNGVPAIRLKNKKTAEAQKAETVLVFTFVSNKMSVLLSFMVIYRSRHNQLLKQQAISKVTKIL